MASDVAVLDEYRHDPHACGEAICAACRHEWVSVAPVGTAWFECPSCGSMKGLFKNAFYPHGDKSAWHCNCGCDVFYATPGEIHCYNCGQGQRF